MSTEDYRERELKFDVPDRWELPDPGRLAPAGGSVEREVVHLESTYFDTATRDLLRSQLTLRRRTGDIDNGWQLKVPDGDARVEIRTPLGGRGVPADFRDATLGVRGRAALRPIAIITTVREIHRLLDDAGSTLAEIVVDEVTATELGEAAVLRQWREVEVELGSGSEQLLQRAARWLRKHGATPAASASKLARALGVETPPPPDTDRLAGLIAGYLDQQFKAIIRGDLELRRGRDAIHATRVATRRYRSVLRVFGPVFDGPGGDSRTAALNEELAWYAVGLGAVRDLQVLRAHLDGVLGGLPPELGPVAARIRQALDAKQQQAEAELATRMRTSRYFALLAELRNWHDQPPTTVDRPAADAAKYLGRAERTVAKRLKQIDSSPDENAAAHRARKAAKRARYIAELCEPALGKRARKAMKSAKKLQQLLGDEQDGVVAAEFLRGLGLTSGPEGRIGFGFGLLYERELLRTHGAHHSSH
jgi:CHAD domain-containing protein